LLKNKQGVFIDGFVLIRRPEDPKGGTDINIRKELTDFTMPEGTMAWFTSGSTRPDVYF
jgi:hypothetical protein